MRRERADNTEAAEKKMKRNRDRELERLKGRFSRLAVTKPNILRVSKELASVSDDKVRRLMVRYLFLKEGKSLSLDDRLNLYCQTSGCSFPDPEMAADLIREAENPGSVLGSSMVKKMIKDSTVLQESFIERLERERENSAVLTSARWMIEMVPLSDDFLNRCFALLRETDGTGIDIARTMREGMYWKSLDARHKFAGVRAVIERDRTGESIQTFLSAVRYGGDTEPWAEEMMKAFVSLESIKVPYIRKIIDNSSMPDHFREKAAKMILDNHSRIQFRGCGWTWDYGWTCALIAELMPEKYARRWIEICLRENSGQDFLQSLKAELFIENWDIIAPEWKKLQESGFSPKSFETRHYPKIKRVVAESLCRENGAELLKAFGRMPSEKLCLNYAVFDEILGKREDTDWNIVMGNVLSEPAPPPPSRTPDPFAPKDAVRLLGTLKENLEKNPSAETVRLTEGFLDLLSGQGVINLQSPEVLDIAGTLSERMSSLINAISDGYCGAEQGEYGLVL